MDLKQRETAQHSNIEIRDLDSVPEMRAVEGLQKEVWRIPDIEVVPQSQLVAAKKCGGVVLGAYHYNSLVGFVYGFASIEHRRVTHHSHMLGVTTEYRKKNIGYFLKLEQRKRVLEQGIDTMTWTFDPIRCGNAHFNFAKLGVTADRYFPDLYGVDGSSFLHWGSTDRLWVSWQLRGFEEVSSDTSLADDCESDFLPALLEVGEHGEPLNNDSEEVLSSNMLTIEIPKVLRHSTHEWRLATRGAFTRALSIGLIVDGFCSSKANVGAYVLRRR